MRKQFLLSGAWVLAALLHQSDANAQQPVTLSINATAPRKPISPYIYGTNDYYPHAGAMRLGGNRMTSYNWENNASNAGHDWEQHSDDWLPWHFGVPDSSYNKPGATITHYHNQALAQGAYSLITLPMAGYVANDKNGTIEEQDAAPSARWAKVVAYKNAPLSLQPDLNDHAIYVDEELNFLLNKFGTSNTATGIKAYSLDNEPCLWSSSHERLWGNRTDGTTVQNLMNKSIELASLIKQADPGAEVFGPALYGFTAYQNLQFAADWDQVRQTGNYNYFIEYYLARMKAEEQLHGKRLLDVFDLHWYPEGNATYGVSPSNDRSDRNSVAARLEMTRSLWDSTYVENTWIGREHANGILPLLPKLKNIVNHRYPGTKLALTEYSYMGTGHISGAIAEADALGIFGQQGLYLATYWGGVEGYIRSGFDVFRNYDGNGGTFGENGLPATSDDRATASVYASIHGNDESKLHAIAMNKHMDSAIAATITVNSTHQYKSARVWILDNKGTALRQVRDVRVISNNSFTYTLPPMTIAHFVLTEEDLSIYPYFDSVATNANVGYSDGNARLSVAATVLDGDHNINAVTIDLSPIGGQAATPMTRNGDQYTALIPIPRNTASGLKLLTMTATDADGHVIKETIAYRVIKKLAPTVIWDGDIIATGEGSTFYDEQDSHAAELNIRKVNTGGNLKPGALSMHMAHDPYKWNLFAWRFDPNPGGAKDISEYGFVEFYIKSNAPRDADLEISLRDASADMNVSNSILLKAQGYVSSFSDKYYTRVRVPVAVFANGTNLDLTRIWQMNFSSNTATRGFDVWIDDISAAPYTNTPVQPKVTGLQITPGAAYADNQTLVTITATATDPDNNIKKVNVDLSPLDLPNNKTLTLTNGVYTATFKVPVSAVSGKKQLRLSVTDANYNQADSVIVFDVHPQATTDVIWDADSIATGTFTDVNEEFTRHAIDTTGGHNGPKVMKLHLEHGVQNPFSAVILDWNEGTGNNHIVDFTTKRYLNFYLKTSAVSPDFDLMLILKDQYAREANVIWLKAEGYVSSFGNNYQLVRIPVSELGRDAQADLGHMTRIGFLSEHLAGGVDVFVDDIALSGSPVADVQFSVQAAQCGANGAIRVDRVVAPQNSPLAYYIGTKVNPAGINNPEFTKLLPGSYNITVKNDSGFIYKETLTVPGTNGVKLTGVADSSGNIDITASGGSGAYAYAWSNGATTEDLANLVSGTYKVTVTDALTGCTIARSFAVTNPGLTIRLYPNPATAYINVEFAATQPVTGTALITITDKFGATVATRSFTAISGTERFNLPGLTPGLYYVTIAVNGRAYSKSFVFN